MMRILLFSGKGGVGKTSLAAATGVKLSKLGYRTLVMSVDPAHSLSDAFDLSEDLFQTRTADPYEVRQNLWVQEINIQREVKRHWKEISAYLVSLLKTTGISDVEAEELAILPGMEELSAMMYVNQYRRSGTFDVVILDCAPTAESLRFVSMPTTLEWYMKHIFPFHRSLVRAVRPLANRVAPMELPDDNYFANIQSLFEKLEGIDKLLEDPQITSVRLVTNPERMVLRETQRAFVYFSLHGLTIDMVIVNRVLPIEAHGEFLENWKRQQEQLLKEIQEYFSPVLVKFVPLQRGEVLGLEQLENLAEALYPGAEDPAQIHRTERPYYFEKSNGRYQVIVRLPFATKGEIGLFKKGDELVVEIGTVRRHIGLPSTMASMIPKRARLEDNTLTVELQEA